MMENLRIVYKCFYEMFRMLVHNLGVRLRHADPGAHVQPKPLQKIHVAGGIAKRQRGSQRPLMLLPNVPFKRKKKFLKCLFLDK